MTISRRDIIKAGAVLPFIGSIESFIPLDKISQTKDNNVVGKLYLYQLDEDSNKLNVYNLDCINNANVLVGTGNNKIESLITTICKVSNSEYETIKSIEGGSILQAGLQLDSKGYTETERDCPFDENAFEVIKNKEPMQRYFIMKKPFFICFEEGENTLSITLGGNKIAELELLMKYYDPQIGGIQNTFTEDFVYENCLPKFDNLSCSSRLSCGRLIRKKIT